MSLQPWSFFTTFQRATPPKFAGIRDGIAVDEWVAQLDKLFDVIHVPDDGERVRLASLCLTDQADAWWRRQRASDDVSTMPWITFTQRFYAEYFLQAERDSLRSQFEALKQGKLSVSDYADQFTRLERFVPGLCATERDRILRFKKGLNDYLRPLIISHTFDSLWQAINAA